MDEGAPYASYRMDYSKGIMIVDCGGADGKDPDLKSPECLAAVIRHLKGELRVDGIVLNHCRERHYGVKTIQALQGVITLSSLFSDLSRQGGIPEFHGLTRKEAQERCGSCAFSPAILFPGLQERLLRALPVIDVSSFLEETGARAADIALHKYTGCRSCIRRAVDDLFFMLGQVASFAQRLANVDNRGSER